MLWVRRCGVQSGQCCFSYCRNCRSCDSLSRYVGLSVGLSVHLRHLFLIAHFAVLRLTETHCCPSPTASDRCEFKLAYLNDNKYRSSTIIRSYEAYRKKCHHDDDDDDGDDDDNDDGDNDNENENDDDDDDDDDDNDDDDDDDDGDDYDDDALSRSVSPKSPRDLF